MRVKLDYKKRRHTEKVEEDIYDFTIINHCWNNLSVVKWLVRWGRLLSSSLLYTPLDIKEENFMPKQPKHQSCLTWLAVDSQINSSKLFFGTIMAHHFHESWNGGIEEQDEGKNYSWLIFFNLPPLMSDVSKSWIRGEANEYVHDDEQ